MTDGGRLLNSTHSFGGKSLFVSLHPRIFRFFNCKYSHALAEKDTLFRLRMDWEKMELSSPPKPTRIVDCLMPDSGVEEQIYQRTEQTSPDNASFLEQDGEVNLSPEKIISLPALAGEVAVAQKQQISDLSKKLAVLDKLKVMANAKKSYLSLMIIIC